MLWLGRRYTVTLEGYFYLSVATAMNCCSQGLLRISSLTITHWPMTNELSPAAGKKGQEFHEMVYVIVPTVYRDTWQECWKYFIFKVAPNPNHSMILCVTSILSKY